MFQLYTEKARRTVYFARYEASQYGSPYIETEHILLGLLREDQRWTVTLRQRETIEVIRQQIESRSSASSKIHTSIDLPLSNESKRVLAYSAEEAARLGHHHIGTEHLLLGLMREKKSFAASILQQHGFGLDKLRKELGESDDQILPKQSRQRSTLEVQDPVEIHGSLWDGDYIRDAVAKYREYSWYWHKRSWMPRDIAIYRENGSVSFDLSLAEDHAHFDLAKAGWKKDRCAVCRWELFESKDDPQHGMGYTNGLEWLCTECYEKLVAPPNV
jgi:hypothetical protein